MVFACGLGKRRNPFQGGMGFFTKRQVKIRKVDLGFVAIPFRVGWDFSRYRNSPVNPPKYFSRNPFQGGMGFFTERFLGSIPG